MKTKVYVSLPITGHDWKKQRNTQIKSRNGSKKRDMK